MVNKIKSRRISLFILLVVLIFLIIFSLFSSSKFVGYSLLDFDISKTTYSYGQKMGGDLNIILNNGELLPKDTVVRLETTAGDFYEYKLSSVVGFESSIFETNGNFFVKGNGLVGEGSGYGVPGNGEKPIDVDFKLIVYSVKDKKEYGNFIVKKVIKKTISQGGSSSGSSSSSDVSVVPPPSEPDPAPSDPAPSLPAAPVGLVIGPITNDNSPADNSISSGSNSVKSDGGFSGNSGSGTETLIPGVPNGNAEIIQGRVNKNENFVYFTDENKSEVRVVSGSVKIDGVPVADNKISFKINDEGTLTVSTDYSEDGFGFGKDFLSDDSITIKIPLNRFDMLAKGKDTETISAELIWNNKVLDYTSKQFKINDSVEEITEPEVNVDSFPSDVFVNSPVGWISKIYLSQPTEKLKISVPEFDKSPEITGIVRGNDAGFKLVAVKLLQDKKDVEVVKKETGGNGGVTGITGKVTTDISLGNKEGAFGKFVNSLRSFFGTSNEGIEETPDIGVEDSTDLEIIGDENGFAKKVEIKYFTEGPESVEKEIDRGKEIEIIPTNFVYDKVIAWTKLSDQLRVKRDMVSVYWVEGEELVDYTALDTNADSFIDYVEWDIKKLKDKQNYIVKFSPAQHLDSNKKFVGDIFPSINLLDGEWSETISDGDYIRVEFKQPLDSNDKIKIYPRVVSGNPTIEVYPVNDNMMIANDDADGGEMIVKIDNLVDNEGNEIPLFGINDKFDLLDFKITGGEVELDHIFDPGDLPPEIEFSGVTPKDGEGAGIKEDTIPIGLETRDEDRRYSFVDFNNDSLLWLRMDDYDKTNREFHDLSSYDNVGISNGDVLITNGYWGKSGKFDGSGDSISLVDEGSLVSNFNRTSKFTVVAWIKSLENGKNGQIVSDMGRNGKGWALRYNKEGKLEFVVSDGSVSQSCFFSTSLDGNWHLIGGSFVNGSLNCVLDGEWQEGPGVFVGNDFSNDVPISIGSLNGKSGVFAWTGQIDDVLIFNRALDKDELFSLYGSKSFGSYLHNFGNLVGGENKFQGHVVDMIGQKRETEVRTVVGVVPCLISCEGNVCFFGLCAEGDDCVIDRACVLNSQKCSDSQCNFGNFVVNDKVYSLQDNGGDGLDLNLEVNDLEFGTDGAFIFNGKSGQQGGVGGKATISIDGLFKRKNAKFIGYGGFSDNPMWNGGDGGNLGILYHGLDGGDELEADLQGGESKLNRGFKKGNKGRATVSKDVRCDVGKGESRDVDVDNDGVVGILDTLRIINNYDKVFGDQEFEEGFDINCDGKLDVRELARIGHQWNTRD